MTDKTFYEMDAEERLYRLKQSWRHLARRIFVYLKANPNILNSNNNQEVFDYVREIQIRYRKTYTPDYSYEDAVEFEDFMSDLESKADGKNYYVEQEVMDLYRPGVEHSEMWKLLLFNELFTYYISPEIYTKEIHELAENHDAAEDW